MGIEVTFEGIDTPVAKPTRQPRPAPERCDYCLAKLKNYFVKGLTRFGLHRTMCVTCHQRHGTGLGSGHGTLYQINSAGREEVWG